MSRMSNYSRNSYYSCIHSTMVVGRCVSYRSRMHVWLGSAWASGPWGLAVAADMCQTDLPSPRCVPYQGKAPKADNLQPSSSSHMRHAQGTRQAARNNWRDEMPRCHTQAATARGRVSYLACPPRGASRTKNVAADKVPLSKSLIKHSNQWRLQSSTKPTKIPSAT